ncbi:MAG: 16S rRNA (adenine(1518)-N(6)/adenine(1519)-N(6))-dimethyltransferase RsmA [Patescibacteria group bacterium]|nr:16S rRNA (adenine(1518)-N(6)/adenine(1519)-N(6))-dimethyltransferase RsmA [Patescibacteria group bacterium]
MSRKMIRKSGVGARLGQHFLTGAWAAAKLASSVGVKRGETILEIGPGKGALTRELLKRGPVVAIEKDETLVNFLKREFAYDIASGRLRVVQGDVRNVSDRLLDAGPYVVAANIPYYITGEIIRQFLTAKHQPRAMALLVQKEVADRIIARSGKESILSLSVKIYGNPKMIAKVSRGNFSPPPSVDSAVILIENISRAAFSDPSRSGALSGAGISEEDFFATVRAGFASKRKQIAGNLARAFGAEAATALAACDISGKTRAEDIPLEKWVRLTRALNA